MSMVKFCENCQREVESSIIERPNTYKFKGETFEIIEKVLVCGNCEEDLYDETLDSETMNTLKAMYEERIGLSLSNIKSIRSQYGLSMELFSKILGWSKSTIARYETGKYIPSSSHMAILKQLYKHPEDIVDYFEMNKHQISANEQMRIKQQLNKFLNNHQIDKYEKALTEAVNINYTSNEMSIESGFNKFSFDKIVQMIIFFAEKSVPKTKLMKLLFYSDFLNFKRNAISISGVSYEKLPYGPVPKDHEVLLKSLEKSNIIDINYEQINQYNYMNVSAKETFNKNLFSKEEIDTMKFVAEKFKHIGSVAISDFSHQERGWKETNDREIITYDYAQYLQLD